MPRAREAKFSDALFAQARDAMRLASARTPYPPRFVVEGARCMARHLAISESRMEQLLPEAALYQCFLPSAISSDPAHFEHAASCLPVSFDRLRSELADSERYPQLIVIAFHMSGMQLVAALLNTAWKEMGRNSRHVLLAPRNMSWLRQQSGVWVTETAEAIAADRPGLRRLLSGLRDGSIQRLFALVDGPFAPGSAGTRALTGISPDLCFRSGLLNSVLSMGIPVLPLTHYWESDRLVLDCHPILTSPREGIDAVAGCIEELLRKHPEQWLNWTAASLRTFTAQVSE
jgi:hypothetical protein